LAQRSASGREWDLERLGALRDLASDTEWVVPQELSWGKEWEWDLERLGAPRDLASDNEWVVKQELS
jgi:hypothetical protein